VRKARRSQEEGSGERGRGVRKTRRGETVGAARAQGGGYWCPLL